MFALCGFFILPVLYHVIRILYVDGPVDYDILNLNAYYVSFVKCLVAALLGNDPIEVLFLLANNEFFVQSLATGLSQDLNPSEIRNTARNPITVAIRYSDTLFHAFSSPPLYIPQYSAHRRYLRIFDGWFGHSTAASRTQHDPSNDGKHLPYRFEESLSSGNRIRLIKTIPSSGVTDMVYRAVLDQETSELRVELVTVALEDAPAFEAVSYVWGKESATRELWINDRTTLVSDTVFDILKGRGRFHRSRYIWIDSVCINQQDNLEKRGQVQLMTAIFRTATRVIVWLDQHSNAAPGRDLLLHLWRVEHLERDSIYKKPTIQLLDYEQLVAGVSEPTEQWSSLMNLLEHPWFGRTWIIQELVVSRAVHIIYGGMYIDWELLSSVADLLHGQDIFGAVTEGQDMERPSAASALRSLSNLALLRRYYRGHRRMNLVDILGSFTHHQVTIPRDKVYALQALTSDNLVGPLPVEVDYTGAMTDEDVFISTARVIAASKRGHALLPLAGHGIDDNRLRLPSWVPNWSRQPIAVLSTGAFGFRRYNANKNYRYRASGSRSTLPTISGTTVSPALQVSGVKATQIKDIHQVICSDHHTSDDFNLVATALSSRLVLWNVFATTHVKDPYPHTHQSLSEVFARTLIGDRDGDSRPADPSFLERFTIENSHFLLSPFDRPERQARALPRQVEYLAAKRDLRRGAFPNSSNGPSSVLKGDDGEPQRDSSTPRTNPSGTVERSYEDTLSQEPEAETFLQDLRKCAVGRKMCVTDDGHLGLVPPLAEVGDWVCVLFGCEVPYVLRPLEEGGFILVGECYMHGMMDGEALRGEVEERVFELV